ncbi:MAG: immunoglobulin domain-containing protein [Candidatus Didemnitutus sp.]|nr:immunoglobulin domain-containing protein [Candidatus Didemnitutus sp.]
MLRPLALWTVIALLGVELVAQQQTLPAILTHPASQIVHKGESVSFNVEAVGPGPFTYQWVKDGTQMTDGRAATLSLVNVDVENAGIYFVVVTNSAGFFVQSNTAELVVIAPPKLVTQPTDQSAAAGANAWFYVSAIGTGPFAYRWQWRARDDEAWGDLTEDAGTQGVAYLQLILTNSLARHGGRVRCIVSNSVGETTSAEARLFVAGAITVQSATAARRVVAPGTSVVFDATAESAVGSALTYQWKRNNRPLPGATGMTLSLSNVTMSDAGAYTLEVRDAYGAVARLTRFLVVDPGPTQVRAWGANASGQTNVPLDLNNALAVAAGRTHSVALRVDGTLTLWGEASSYSRSYAASITNAVAVAAYGDNTLYLHAEGGISQFGAQNAGGSSSVGGIAVALGGNSGQRLTLREDGTVASINLNSLASPRPPDGLSDVVAIAAGGRHSVALKEDGTLVSWGEGAASVVGVPAGLNDIQAIAAGEAHTLALRVDGTVVAWGDNSAGQRSVPANLNNVVGIAAGPYHSIARRADGSLVFWGRNISGQGTPPEDLGPVFAVAGGESHTLAVRGSSGDIAPRITTQPASVQADEGTTATLTVATVGSGPLHYQWRLAGVAIVGANSSSYSVTATSAAVGFYDVVVTNHIGSVTSETVSLAVVGENSPPALTSRSAARILGTLGGTITLSASAVTANPPLTYQWNRQNRPIAGATDPTLALSNFNNGDAGAYTLVITDGRGLKTYVTSFVVPHYEQTQVVGWGYTTTATGGADTGQAIAITPGYFLQRDGTIRPWGTLPYVFRNQPAALAGVVALHANDWNAIALLSNGKPVVWGDTLSSVTTIPASATQLIDVSFRGHALGLTAAGTVVAWGANTSGQASVPAGLSEVVQVAAGGTHSLALLRNGTVVAWGNNAFGQSSVPAGLSNVVSIAAGTQTSFAVRADGSIVAWGQADQGNQTTVPAAAQPAFAVVAGSYHVLAIKADGTVASWGWNTYGQLAVPATLKNVFGAVLGNSYTVALRDASGDSLPTVTMQPTGGRRAAGGEISLTVVAGGPGPLSYQWRRNGTNLPGKTSATLVLENLQLGDGGVYDVVVSNHRGSVTSAGAEVVVEAPPAIVTAPPDLVSANLGDRLELAVTATSANLPLSYQWRKNNRLIPGAISATLSFDSFAREDAGTYSLEITDATGLRSWFIAFVRPVFARTQVVAWGYGMNPDATLSSEPIVAVDPSGVAVRRDGTVVALRSGVSHPALGRTGIAKVVGQLLLKADGTVESVSQTGGNIHFNLPPGLANVVDLQINYQAAFALKADGTIVAWGDNDYGELNFSTIPTNVVQIATGGNYVTYALKEDGTIIALGSRSGVEPPPGVTLPPFQRIAAGAYFIVGQTFDGGVVAWGNIALPETALGGPPSGVVEVAAGAWHVLLRNADGVVQAWGSNAQGQSAVPPTLASNTAALFAYQDVSIAVRDASGDTAPTIVRSPQNISALPGQTAAFAVEVSGAGPFSYQWRKDGVEISGATAATFARTVTANDVGSYDVVISNHIGSTTSAVATLAVGTLPVVSLAAPRRQAAVPGETMTLRVAATGTGALRYQWYHDGRPLPEQNSAVLTLRDVTVRANGYYYVDVTDDVGPQRSETMFVTVAPQETRVVAFGFSLFDANRPPADLADAIAIAAGDYHSLALRRDGTVAAWGSTSGSQVPAGLTDVVAIAGGSSHSLALKSDGTVVIWGSGNSAAIAAGLKDVVAIAAARDISVALKRDGSVVVWSEMFNGAHDYFPHTRAVGKPFAGSKFVGVIDESGGVSLVGLGEHGVMTPPAGLAGVRTASSMESHVVALRDDGTIVAWGYNLAGQANVPDGLQDVVAVAAGSGHSLALRADGAVVRWGRETELMPADLPEGVAIAAGASHSLVLCDLASTTLVVTGHPTNRSVFTGDSVRFSVSAAGAGTLSHRWQRLAVSGAWVDLAEGGLYTGTATSQLTVSPAAVELHGERYRCRVSNGNETVSSESAALFILGSGPRAPVISLSAWDERRVGQSLSIMFSVGDANGDLLFATLRIKTPGRGWRTLLPNGTTIASDEFTLANALTTTSGLRMVAFTSTAEDGPGTYIIASSAIDAAGLRTDHSIEVVVGENRPPTATLFLSGERTLGETITASLHVNDADGNFAFANLRIQTPDRGWIIVRSDGATVTAPDIDAAHNSVAGFGATNRTFAFTPTDGAGVYTFILSAVDTVGARTDTVAQSISVAKRSQTIAFDLIADRRLTLTPFHLTATASSGLPVTFTVLAGPAIVDGDKLFFTGVGNVTVQALQTGNGMYAVAPALQRTFAVLKSFDSWQLAHLGDEDRSNAMIFGASADPDGDGITNLLEYALGLDPRVASNADVPTVAASASEWTFTYTRPADRSDVTYTVQTSTSLTTWTDVAATRTATGPTETWRATVPFGPVARFFRLRIGQ